MMLIATVVQARFSFVSGVFETVENADAFLARVPVDARGDHQMVVLDLQSFPVFIIEEGRRFRFLAGDRLPDEFDRQRGRYHRDGEDYCYMNLYRVDGEWSPKRAGVDAMGSLRHWHVTNDSLGRIEREASRGAAAEDADAG